MCRTLRDLPERQDVEGLPPPVFSRDHPIRVVSTKYDGGEHYAYDAYLVDVVGPVVRCWVERGTPWSGYRGEGLTRVCETAIYFTDRFYNIRHMHTPAGRRRFETYVNIALPARFDGETLRWVDLDIDVVREESGVIIDDEDEFAEHRVRMLYPDDLVAEVQRATAEATRLLHREAFPFDRRAHIPGRDLPGC